MPEGDRATVERIIANTINETARGDPDALAPRIVAALTAAGFRIVAASGRGDSALARQLAETRPLYRSPNGEIAGASPAIPRRARPLSGTRRTPRQAVT
jgi:hypothetical protein